MQHNTDKEKATVRQKTPANPNMKTDTQTDTQRLAKAIYGEDSPEYQSTQTHPKLRFKDQAQAEAEAHAAKLAEALRRLLDAYSPKLHESDASEWHSAISEASAVLVQYEGKPTMTTNTDSLHREAIKYEKANNWPFAYALGYASGIDDALHRRKAEHQTTESDDYAKGYHKGFNQ